MSRRVRGRAAPFGVAAVTLLTDFGVDDVYVGAMKGVILSTEPRARIVDLTHGILPQDVRQGGVRWASAVGSFPPGTVHVAVVDPGVGSERRIVALRAHGYRFLAPDNGLLGFIATRAEIDEAVSVEEPRFWLPKVSRTFHGRDIIAPVAARLAGGLRLSALGPPVRDVLRIPVPVPTRRPATTGQQIFGEIVDIDHYGNCLTNLSGPARGELLEIRVGRRSFKLVLHSYAEARRGAPLAIVGSGGFLEIAVSQGNAARVLGLRIGQGVRALCVDASQDSSLDVSKLGVRGRSRPRRPR